MPVVADGSLSGSLARLSGAMRLLTAHRVFRNAAALGLVQVANYASGFVVLIHLTRVLGVESYGVAAFAIGVVQLGSVVLDLGFAMAATARVAVLRDDAPAVERFAGAVLLLKLIAWAIGAACILAAVLAFPQRFGAGGAVVAWTIVPLLGHALQPIWFFQGLERMRLVTLSTVAAKLCYLLLVLAVVRAESDATLVLAADGAAQLLAAAIGILLLRREGHGIRRPSVAEVRSALRLTRGFFVSRVASIVQTGTGVLVLGLVGTPAAVGLYSLAEQLYRALHAVFATLTHALYPYMARERDLSLLRRVTVGVVLVAAGGALLGHVLGPMVIPPLLGQEWVPALGVLDVFLVAIVVHAAVLMATYPLAAALDRLDVANRAVTVAAALQVLGVVLLAAGGWLAPVPLAWLMVATEAYLLVHCGAVLLPLARRRHGVRGGGLDART